MNTAISEENDAVQATVTPEATQKASVRARRAHVGPSKARSGRKTTPAKKAPKRAKKANGARAGSKTAKILDLLRRPGGVTAKELTKASGWLPHSIRGFLSGTVGKKMGLTVTSTKAENGERSYSVEG